LEARAFSALLTGAFHQASPLAFTQPEDWSRVMVEVGKGDVARDDIRSHLVSPLTQRSRQTLNFSHHFAGVFVAPNSCEPRVT
jgi:hypothetical protein